MHRFSVASRATLVLLLVACTKSGGTATPGSGEFTAEWTGSDTGGLSAPPRVFWCAAANRLDVTAEREDVGVALAFYLTGDPRSGFGPRAKPEILLPVFDPGIDTAIPPAVAVVSRWFDQKAVQAYQSDSGAVTLAVKAGALEARFGVRLRALNGVDTVRMEGHFGGVQPQACPSDSASPPAPAPPPADTGSSAARPD